MRETQNWERQYKKDLVKLAPQFGVDPKGKTKKELIHDMRVAYWKGRG